MKKPVSIPSLDMKAEQNPSLQCGKCGRWMRLHGGTKGGQRLYHCYTRLDGSFGCFHGQEVKDGEDGSSNWCNDCILALPDAKPY